MSTSTPLATRILWGLVIGVVAAVATLGIGQFHPATLQAMQAVSTAVLDPFGQVFLRMLFFVVIPLVFASLASGVAQLGRLDRLGPLALRTFGLFAANMLIGVAIGLLMMNLLQPGHHLAEGARALLMQEYGGGAMQAVQRKAEQPGPEALQRPKHAFGIRERGTDEDVHVLRGARLMMHAERVAADDEKRRALLGQDGQHLDVFG